MPSYSAVWALVYVSAVSLVGFVLMGLDKKKAALHQRRIPEKTLFLTASIGGSVGVLLGMWFFRHKTKHVSFALGIPLILLAQLFVLGLFLRGM